MIQAILFDLNDTLVTGLTGIEVRLQPLLHQPGDVILKQFRSDFMLDFLLGYCSEDDYLSKVKQANGWEPSVEQIKAIIREHFKTAMPGVGAIVAALAKQYPLYLVSDNGREWTEYVEQEHAFLGLFTRRFYSFDSHTRKNNPDTFRSVLREIGMEANTCLFIDDRAAFLDTAAQIGLIPVLFEGSAQLREKLKDYGITV